MSRKTVNIPLFSNGLNTEVSDLKDLYGYTKDELNCIIYPDGSRGRRLGFEYENLFEFSKESAIFTPEEGSLQSTKIPLAFGCYEWENYKGDGASVIAVQIGRYIVFFKGVQKGVLSADESNYRIDLNDYKVGEGDDYQFEKVSFKSAYGVLFISSPKIEVIRVKFSESYQYDSQFPASTDLFLGGLDYGRYDSFYQKESYFTITLEDETTSTFYPFLGAGTKQYSTRNSDTLADAFNFVNEEERLGFVLNPITERQYRITSPLGTRYNGAKVHFYAYVLADNKKDAWKHYNYDVVLWGAHEDEVSVEGGLVVEAITPKIRDSKGIEDGVKNETTPSELTPEHEYNLINQGWNKQEITDFHTELQRYPSNAMQWFVAKDSNNEFIPENLLKAAFGSTQAPRGSIIMNAYTHDRSAQSGVTGIPTNRFSSHRPADIAFFAGRLWYGYDDTVLFSQILAEDTTLADRCYQAADPTSEEVSDPIDTDGGTMHIQECGSIIRFAVAGSALIIFGTKGIVAILPGNSIGFTPTSYYKYVVSSVGTTSKWSIVEAGNAVFYWNHLGINMLNFVDNSLQVQVVSFSTVQTFFKKLKEFSILNCQGYFNAIRNEVVFCYPTVEGEDKRLDGILIFNISQNSWVPWRVELVQETSPFIVGAVRLKTPIETSPLQVVTVGGEEVVIEEKELITINKKVEDFIGHDSISYLTLDGQSNRVTFANPVETSFRDWGIGDRIGSGYTYDSYLVSHPMSLEGVEQAKTTLPKSSVKDVYSLGNYRFNANIFTKQQVPYVTNVFRKTEEEGLFRSGCYMSARWDWSTDDRSYKWTQKQQVYRPSTFADSHEYVITKTRLRGSGRSLQLMYESEGDKDFRLCSIGLDTRGWYK